jgi:hypothetical protein
MWIFHLFGCLTSMQCAIVTEKHEENMCAFCVNSAEFFTGLTVTLPLSTWTEQSHLLAAYFYRICNLKLCQIWMEWTLYDWRMYTNLWTCVVLEISTLTLCGIFIIECPWSQGWGQVEFPYGWTLCATNLCQTVHTQKSILKMGVDCDSGCVSDCTSKAKRQRKSL